MGYNTLFYVLQPQQTGETIKNSITSNSHCLLGKAVNMLKYTVQYISSCT